MVRSNRSEHARHPRPPPAPAVAAAAAGPTGAVRSWPSGSGSPPARSGGTSTGTAQLGYPVDASTGRHRRLPPGPGTRCRRCCSTTTRRRRSPSPSRRHRRRGAAGIEEPALSALAELDRLLPRTCGRASPRSGRRPAARRRGRSERSTPGSSSPSRRPAPTTSGSGSPSVDRERPSTERRVEPYRLVTPGRRWYLVAHDVDRDDWRTLPGRPHPASARTGHRFARQEHPDGRRDGEPGGGPPRSRPTATPGAGAPRGGSRRRRHPHPGHGRRCSNRTATATPRCSPPAPTTWPGWPATWSGLDLAVRGARPTRAA